MKAVGEASKYPKRFWILARHLLECLLCVAYYICEMYIPLETSFTRDSCAFV